MYFSRRDATFSRPVLEVVHKPFFPKHKLIMGPYMRHREYYAFDLRRKHIDSLDYHHVVRPSDDLVHPDKGAAAPARFAAQP